MDSLLKSALKHAEKGKEWLMEDVPVPMEDEILKLAEDVKDRVADTTTAVRERVTDTAAAAAVVGETVKAVVAETVAATASADALGEATEQPGSSAQASEDGLSKDGGPSRRGLSSSPESLSGDEAEGHRPRDGGAAHAPAPTQEEGRPPPPGAPEATAQLPLEGQGARPSRANPEPGPHAAEEIARLHSRLSAQAAEHEAALRAAEDRLRELDVEAQDLRARAARAEGGAECARRELDRLREEHSAELARLTERRDLALEYELRATSELKALKRELAELRGDEVTPQSSQPRGERRPWSDEEAPSKDDLEEGKAEQDELAADAPASIDVDLDTPTCAAESQPLASRSVSETIALRERVDALEKRCVTLQRKLNARPVMYQPLPTAPVGGDGARKLEPLLRAVVGPQRSELAVKLFAVPERALRGFTANLLKYDAWFAVFYVHLLVLYAVVASCLTETSGTMGADVSDINLRQASGPSGVAAGAAAGGVGGS